MICQATLPAPIDPQITLAAPRPHHCVKTGSDAGHALEPAATPHACSCGQEWTDQPPARHRTTCELLVGKQHRRCTCPKTVAA